MKLVCFEFINNLKKNMKNTKENVGNLKVQKILWNGVYLNVLMRKENSRIEIFKKLILHWKIPRLNTYSTEIFVISAIHEYNYDG